MIKRLWTWLIYGDCSQEPSENIEFLKGLHSASEAKMKTWIEDFKPCMVAFVHPCLEDETAIMVQAVCADRVFRVKFRIAVEKAGGNKTALKLLGG